MSITSLTDLEVIKMLNEAKDDLEDAARDVPNSEWHEACFAGVLVLSQEVLRRGLVLGTVH